jgi:hypothetical protein
MEGVAVRQSNMFSRAACTESRNVCKGILPRQYFRKWARSLLYSRIQPSRIELQFLQRESIPNFSLTNFSIAIDGPLLGFSNL